MYRSHRWYYSLLGSNRADNLLVVSQVARALTCAQTQDKGGNCFTPFLRLTQALRHPWLGDLAAKEPPPSPLQQPTLPTGMGTMPPLPETLSFSVPPAVMAAGAAPGGAFNSPGSQPRQQVSEEGDRSVLLFVVQYMHGEMKDAARQSPFLWESRSWLAPRKVANTFFAIDSEPNESRSCFWRDRCFRWCVSVGDAFLR